MYHQNKMPSGLVFVLLLCGLGFGANAGSPPVPASACNSCPPGWTFYGGRCFVFQAKETSWADAEISCLLLGGNLASYHSVEEYNFIRALIYKAAGSNKRTWVGASDAVKENVGFWSDGTKFDFTNWAPGEPNNKSGNENCMEINLNGRDYVNDEICDQKDSFVCSRVV